MRLTVVQAGLLITSNVPRPVDVVTRLIMRSRATAVPAMPAPRGTEERRKHQHKTPVACVCRSSVRARVAACAPPRLAPRASLLCSSLRPHVVAKAVRPRFDGLRRPGGRRVPLGALCTGGYEIARAGLLDHFSANFLRTCLPARGFPRFASAQLFTSTATALPAPSARAPGPHVEPPSSELARGSPQLSPKQFNRRTSPQGHGSPVHSHCAPRFVGIRTGGPDSGGALMEEEPRTAVAGQIAKSTVYRAVNRAPVQRDLNCRTSSTTTSRFACGRAPSFCCRPHAHHGYHHGVRISVAAHFSNCYRMQFGIRLAP